MADNVTLNLGSGGALIRTVYNSGTTTETEVVKLDVGGESAESLVTSSNPVPVGFTQTTPTVSANNGVTSLVLCGSATAKGFNWAHVENATSVSGYVIVYNAISAPSAGALSAGLVLTFEYLPPSGYADLDYSTRPIAGSAGIVILLTSAATPFTYTTGSITGAIAGVAS